ncbi:MAG: right-handed parallel beta-helix repeat-containing protein [Saprospiraceae bacterium]
MNLSKATAFILFLLIHSVLIAQNIRPHQPTRGGVITESCQIIRDTYNFASYPDIDKPVLTIKGSYMTVDFKNSTIIGSSNFAHPDSFQGVGILLEGDHITIKNLDIRGFKIGILAENCVGCQILQCDVSYNYRPRLYSTTSVENMTDWLSYHVNERAEWKRYGAGIYLNFCDSFIIKGNKATGNQNAALIVDSHFGEIAHNNFAFNSGLGIGLYRSSYTYIHHNYLDFNIRGFSLGKYSRGQDSAGLLIYEQAIFNRVEYNTATHCGDGLFLWAGQTTMISGFGGCNDNEIRLNDFSHAATNGVEATFSRNLIEKNKIEDCTYGIWAGYSYNSVFDRNILRHNTTAIAIEHGQQNAMTHNLIFECETGIYNWAKYPQPDWPFVKKKNTPSFAPKIQKNIFINDKVGIKLELTARPLVDENTFVSVANKFAADSSFDLNAKEMNADSFGFLSQQLLYLDTVITSYYPFPFRGKDQIKMTPWGPYDHRYPLVWLKAQNTDTITFEILGPLDFSSGKQYGNWAVNKVEGLQLIGAKAGEFPSTIKCLIQKGKQQNLVLNFTGPSYKNQFGIQQLQQTARSFSYENKSVAMPWVVKYYPYQFDRDKRLLENIDLINQVQTTIALDSTVNTELAFNWWHEPTKLVPEDHFIAIASSEIDLPKGHYAIQICSDDAVNLRINDKLMIEHWEMGESTMYFQEADLEGLTKFKIEKLEDSGFSTLQFSLLRMN